MNRKNPSKAQLRRANERLQRAAKRAHSNEDAARAAMFTAERMRDTALKLLGEIAPDLLDLLERPSYLQEDPGLPVVKRFPDRLPDYLESLRYAAPFDASRCIEHWIARMHIEIEADPARFDNCRMLVFRIRRPKGKDSLAWMHAFDDRMVDHSPTGLRYMIMAMAERLCDELEAKIGGRRG